MAPERGTEGLRLPLKTEGEAFQYDAGDGVVLVSRPHPHAAMCAWPGESVAERLQLVLGELDHDAANGFWWEIPPDDARELAALIRAALGGEA